MTISDPQRMARLEKVALLWAGAGLACFPLGIVSLVLGVVLLASGYRNWKALAALCSPLLSGGFIVFFIWPSFVRYESVAKQAEAKAELKGAVGAELNYREHYGSFSTSPSTIGFSIYAIPYSNEQLLNAIPSAVRQELGIHGDCSKDCWVTLACAGQIDLDETIDVWSISTKERRRGEKVIPANAPFNEVDDSVK